MNGYTSSLWYATAPPRDPRAPLDGDAEADVVIVGAGYTGLWTAYHLAVADPRLRIVVLEAREVGFGASGRNGGWCSAKVSGIADLLADPRSRRSAVALQREMFRTVEEVGRVVAVEGIDCAYHRGGTVVVATRPTHVARLRAQVELRRACGFEEDDFAWWEPDRVAERVRPARNLGGTFTPHCAALHPLRLARGLADAVERRGVTLHEGTRALRLEPHRVVTDRGTVAARRVVRATEAYTARLPGLRREVAPVWSLMVATEPLPDAVWAEIGLGDRETFSDGRRLVVYGQRTADGRLAFGGRGAPYHYASRLDDRFDDEPRVFEALAATLRDLFPPAADAEITHRWGGPLAVARDWQPGVVVDADTDEAWAGGYAGQGVAAAHLAGRILADLLLGAEGGLAGLPLVGHRSRGWEPEPLRWLGINAGLVLTAWVDRSEDRSGRPARLRGAVLERLIGL